VLRDRKIKSKNVVLASDHAGFKLKEEIKKFLIKKKGKVLDLGTKNTNSVDYPDYAHLLSKKMKKLLGILVLGLFLKNKKKLNENNHNRIISKTILS